MKEAAIVVGTIIAVTVIGVGLGLIIITVVKKFYDRIR